MRGKKSNEETFWFRLNDKLEVHTDSFCLKLKCPKHFKVGYFSNLIEIFHTIIIDTKIGGDFKMLKRDLNDLNKAKSLVKEKIIDVELLRNKKISSLKDFVECLSKM